VHEKPYGDFDLALRPQGEEVLPTDSPKDSTVSKFTEKHQGVLSVIANQPPWMDKTLSLMERYGMYPGFILGLDLGGLDLEGLDLEGLDLEGLDF